MPAVITHHLFGEEAVSLLPEGIIQNQEELLAFLLGNQGPDPLFSRALTIPEAAHNCHVLARKMHDGKVLEAFMALHQGVSHLPEQDKTLGRAFVLGLLGHYLLDSRAHAFVYAQQDDLTQANPELEDAQHELHAIIESDIDTWMLWSMRHLTVLESPAADYLARTERVDRVAGALVSAMAQSVFGLSINPEEYGGAVSNYETIFRLIDPLESLKVQAIARVEMLLRSHSMARALAHSAKGSDECPAANLEHRRWKNPYTGEPSSKSFADLFFEALEIWEELSEAYVKADEKTLAPLMGKLNYDGKPVER